MSSFTVNDYCKALLSTMVEDLGKHDLHLDDDRTTKVLTSVVDRVWEEAKKSKEAGNRQRAVTLAGWLNVLAPNPNTGAFDGFWQTLRSLQPLNLGVKNPQYIRLDANRDHAYHERTLQSVPLEWKQFVQESGSLFRHAA